MKQKPEINFLLNDIIMSQQILKEQKKQKQKQMDIAQYN